MPGHYDVVVKHHNCHNRCGGIAKYLCGSGRTHSRHDQASRAFMALSSSLDQVRRPRQRSDARTDRLAQPDRLERRTPSMAPSMTFMFTASPKESNDSHMVNTYIKRSQAPLCIYHFRIIYIYKFVPVPEARGSVVAVCPSTGPVDCSPREAPVDGFVGCAYHRLPFHHLPHSAPRGPVYASSTAQRCE